ncbi:Helix-turn-helix protein [Roseovarius sp. THAF27]|nr:Helix-turn-helix protein [Roseovarius sp. THAF27]
MKYPNPAQEMLLALAEEHGIGEQVAGLLVGRRQSLLCNVPLSALLTARRSQIGISRSSMARRVGIAKSVLDDLEKGAPGVGKNPRLPTLRKLAVGYQLSLPQVLVAAIHSMEAAHRVRKN